MENFKCDAQLGFESMNYPNIRIVGDLESMARFSWLLVLYGFCDPSFGGSHSL